MKNKGFTPPFLKAKSLGAATKAKGIKERAGFTFIELFLVAIIILVLAGLATPQFRKPFSGMQLRNTSQNLVQSMRSVQTKAVSERRPYRINFDFENGMFWPSRQDSLQPGIFKRIEAKWAKVYKVPDGISIEVEPSFITFYPDGSADKTEIKLSDSRGKTFTVTVQKNVGYIKVEE